ncbi:hypothetical protein [Komagataeibacter rhaeticus]|uniref:hypothetical protein n=1 Tax=Komagataeibacter rhaeticus TaxID=215221 RepID=UPI001A5E445E|nr:hypothetical protein [Komagataeibacter rhaeticus]MBL7240233.1 hypothetical protein [Komagataeibacter rhaeticus]
MTAERTTRHTEAARLIADREALRDMVQALIDTWVAGECVGRVPVVPFVGDRQ